MVEGTVKWFNESKGFGFLSREGGPDVFVHHSEIKAEGFRTLNEGDRVRFEVVDQGPGIASEHQAGLFEKFFRVPGSPEGGSGLGLFIAKGLVQAQGGQIGIDSEAGQGATFWFTVPIAPSDYGMSAKQ